MLIYSLWMLVGCFFVERDDNFTDTLNRLRYDDYLSGSKKADVIKYIASERKRLFDAGNESTFWAERVFENNAISIIERYIDDCES